jgi:hypothetical protein
LSYGGLAWAPAGEWGTRFTEWLSWARYLAGSTPTGIAFVCGVVILLVWSWRQPAETRQRWLDTLWAVAVFAYLALHSVLAFSIWDRYLLPLAAPVALLGARIVDGLGRVQADLNQHSVLRSVRHAIPYLAVLLALVFGIRAATNGYPIGGEHWAYQGLDTISDHLEERAAPDAVIYHHWLRWHYTYYLHGTGFELRWWRDGAHLRQEARKSADREQYIVLPTWRPLDPDIKGVHFVPVLETRRKDGSVSLELCRIELDPWDD